MEYEVLGDEIDHQSTKKSNKPKQTQPKFEKKNSKMRFFEKLQIDHQERIKRWNWSNKED